MCVALIIFLAHNNAYCPQVAVEKKGKGGKTKLVAKTGGAEVRQWDIMKMMVPGEKDE